MSVYKPSILPDVYVAFRKIPKKSWRDIVQLYEDREDEVELLSIERQLEVLYLYIESLHELEYAQKLNNKVCPLIELSLSESIEVEEGLYYFEKALFWKACALLRLMKYKESQHILKQLVSMNPTDKSYRKHLWLSFFKDKPLYVQHCKTLAMIMFFLAAFIIIVEILLINTFYTVWSVSVEWLRSVLFVAALLLVGTAESCHAVYAKVKIRRKAVK